MYPVKRILIDSTSTPHPRWVPNSVPHEDGYLLDEGTVLAYWRFQGGGGRWDTLDAELLRWEEAPGFNLHTREIGGRLMMHTGPPGPSIKHQAFIVPDTSEPVVAAVQLGRWKMRALMGNETGYRLLA